MKFRNFYENSELDNLSDSELDDLLLSEPLLDDEDFDYDFEDEIDLEIDEDEELDFEDDELSERVQKKKVVRGGKRKIVMKTDRKGYKIVKDPKTGRAKEERLSPKEARNRKLAQIKGARKRKGKSGMSQRKRAMSIKKRPT